VAHLRREPLAHTETPAKSKFEMSALVAGSVRMVGRSETIAVGAVLFWTLGRGGARKFKKSPELCILDVDSGTFRHTFRPRKVLFWRHF
jgi:hypothetical protein